jgi:phosphatidylserine decarboxylase
MKLHKESKGTLLVATIAVALFTFLSVRYLEMYSLLVIVPLFILYGLVFWFFRVPKREILDHKENVIAPVDGKVVMIKEVFEDEFLKPFLRKNNVVH